MQVKKCIFKLANKYLLESKITIPLTNNEQMNKPALAQLFYREAEKILDADLPAGQTARAAAHLLNVLFLEVTKVEKIQFTTPFSRIAYLAQKEGLSRQLQFYIHHFRKKVHAPGWTKEAAMLDLLGMKVLLACINAFFAQAPPPKLQAIVKEDWPVDFADSAIAEYKAQCRVTALDDQPEKNLLLIKDEAQPEREFYVQYDIPERNENFNATIALSGRFLASRLSCNLLMWRLMMNPSIGLAPL